VVRTPWGRASRGQRGSAKKIDTSPLVHECILKAPPAEVWKVWSSGEGFKALGVAKAEVDLRVGGLIRSHYKPDGVLGDDGTIQNEIIAFEPERMIAFRIQKPPKGFPFSQAFKSTWSVVTMTDLGDGRTHLRLAGLGYGADEESQAMRRFFEPGTLGRSSVSGAFRRERSDPKRRNRPRGAAACARRRRCARRRAAGGRLSRLHDLGRLESFLRGRLADRGAARGAFRDLLPAHRRGRPARLRGMQSAVDAAGEMFSHTWNAPPKFPNARERPTWVVAEFEAVQAKLTRVRIRHLGFDEAAAADPPHAAELQETRKYFQSAWPKVLTALRDHFDKSTPK
jgi:uncharacterized protein YndB with AHSA1/START domain